jgi:DNA-binding NarL/FixJ family response regulator
MAGDVVHRRGDRLRRHVVVTFPLPVAAERRLSELLGTGFELVDVKKSSGTEDIVLLPSTSRQLVGKLRAAFPDAAVLVVEVEDAALGVGLAGQVLRTLDAGADGYFVARSVDELASIVDQAADRAQTAEALHRAALTSADEDELSDVLDTLLRQRQDTRAPPLDRDG